MNFFRLNFNSAMNLQEKEFALKTMMLGSYIKILVNYSQIIAILNTLHLNWDQKLSDMFNLHKTISGGVQQVISLECLVEGELILYLCYFAYIFIIKIQIMYPMLKQYWWFVVLFVFAFF